MRRDLALEELDRIESTIKIFEGRPMLSENQKEYLKVLRRHEEAIKRVVKTATAGPPISFAERLRRGI